MTNASFCRETKLHKFEFVVSKEKLKKGLCKGVRLDVYFPGFPTLMHIEHTVRASLQRFSTKAEIKEFKGSGSQLC